MSSLGPEHGEAAHHDGDDKDDQTVAQPLLRGHHRLALKHNVQTEVPQHAMKMRKRCQTNQKSTILLSHLPGLVPVLGSTGVESVSIPVAVILSGHPGH